MLDDKTKRVISALILVLLIFISIYAGGVIFKFGVLAVTAIALLEYINVYKTTDNKVIQGVLFFGYVVNIYIIFSNKAEYMLPMIYLTAMLCMAMPIFKKSYNVISSAITLVGYIYIIDFFSMLAFIREFENGSVLAWIPFIVAWFSDTFAYYAGRFLGRRFEKKLCPRISPKKTVVGFFGGIAGSIVGVILWASLTDKINAQLYGLILLGIVAGIISQIGDLAASLIKRYIGVKDYGNLIPGHGGILDRFDSILFIAPIVYYYIKFFLG